MTPNENIIEWNYETGKATSFRREGECNGCGECCMAETRVRVAGKQLEEDGRNISPATDGIGVWAEYDDTQSRYMVSVDRIRPGDHICPALTADKRCGIQETKFKLCSAWPFHPSHITPFPSCSYRLVKTGEWDMEMKPKAKSVDLKARFLELMNDDDSKVVIDNPQEML